MAGGIKCRKLTHLQSKVGQRRKFDEGFIEIDAYREGSVCLAVAGEDKRRKLDVREPKAIGSRRMLRTGADTADGASTIFLGPPKHAQYRILHVERLYRDKITGKIQELSHLVPTHRLKAEKVRKHILKTPLCCPILAGTSLGYRIMCAF